MSTGSILGTLRALFAPLRQLFTFSLSISLLLFTFLLSILLLLFTLLLFTLFFTFSCCCRPQFVPAHSQFISYFWVYFPEFSWFRCPGVGSVLPPLPPPAQLFLFSTARVLQLPQAAKQKFTQNFIYLLPQRGPAQSCAFHTMFHQKKILIFPISHPGSRPDRISSLPKPIPVPGLEY